MASSSPVSPDLRRILRESPDSVRALAARHGLNPKTVAKWRGRGDGADRPRGPKPGRSVRLTAGEEAAILAYRRYAAPMTLDDLMAVLSPHIPALSRSALYRLLKRHGMSRLPSRSLFGLPEAASRPGCFHMDVLPVTVGGRDMALFLATEYASGLIFALLRPDASQATARDVLFLMADGVPAPVRMVLTPARLAFTTPGNSVSAVPEVRDILERGATGAVHPFEYACAVRGIDHHLVPDHFPWDGPRAEAALGDIGALLPKDEVAARLWVEGALGPHNACPLTSRGAIGAGAFLAAAGGETPRTMEYRNEERVVRRSGRSDSTREAILAAAHSRLAKDGPEGLSLSEVARLAGVNRGTAYQHFRTRDRLITDTARWMSERIDRSVFGEGVRGASVAGLAGRLAVLAADDPDLCRAWLLQLLSTPDPAQDLFWRHYRDVAAGLTGVEGEDAELVSLLILAGAFLWPKWDAPGERGAAQRFASACRRVLRIAE